MEELQIGAKVKYHTGDEKWKNGVIHGVRKVDDVEGVPRVFTYLIDTGRDTKLDVFKHSAKDMVLNKEIQKHTARGVESREAVAKALESTKNMPDEIIETTERQPEQVDCRPEHVKSR